MSANSENIRNNPICAVYCKGPDAEFNKCPDKCIARAIGNFNPKLKDEQIKIKICNRDIDKCKHQVAYFKLPTLPRYFLGNS